MRKRDDPNRGATGRTRRAVGSAKVDPRGLLRYQGFNNAKFGRIECHEAINAYARRFSPPRNSTRIWRLAVVHGIVDSIWVTPDVTSTTTNGTTGGTRDRDYGRVDIRLEQRSTTTGWRSCRNAERRWCADNEATSERWPAKKTSNTRDRSQTAVNPPFIGTSSWTVWTGWMPRGHRTQCSGRLERAIDELQAGNVAVERRLVERNRVSSRWKATHRIPRTYMALKRAREQDLAVHPGQDIEYVVVDDEILARPVALAHEAIGTYAASYYETQLVRAVESVLSPLGWDRSDIRRKLSPAKGDRFELVRSHRRTVV